MVGAARSLAPSAAQHLQSTVDAIVRDSYGWTSTQWTMPKAEDFVVACLEYGAGSALSSPSSAVQEAALRRYHCEAQELSRLVLDCSAPPQSRTRACEMLASSPAVMGYDDVAALLESTSIVPLREALLPLLASSSSKVSSSLRAHVHMLTRARRSLSMPMCSKE